MNRNLTELTQSNSEQLYAHPVDHQLYANEIVARRVKWKKRNMRKLWIKTEMMWKKMEKKNKIMQSDFTTPLFSQVVVHILIGGIL